MLCIWASLLGAIEIVNQLVHTSMQPHICPKVLKHTKQPIVLLVSFLSFPHRGNTEHGPAFGKQIQYQQIAILHILYHTRTWVFRPSLNNPCRFWVDTFHRLQHHASRFSIVQGIIVVAFMERVHAIVIGLAIKSCQFGIIKVGNPVELTVGRRQISGPSVAIPFATVSDIKSQFLFGIMGHHTTEAR